MPDRGIPAVPLRHERGRRRALSRRSRKPLWPGWPCGTGFECQASHAYPAPNHGAGSIAGYDSARHRHGEPVRGESARAL